jgi:transcription antitermination factor NusG
VETSWEFSSNCGLCPQLDNLPNVSTTPWYVACTSPRHEKRVAKLLDQRRVACFLATYSSVRRWKDRRRLLDLPLFPGYVFVQMDVKNRSDVVRVPGVLGLICFQGKPAAISAAELHNLHCGLTRGGRAEPHPYFATGRKVRIRRGPLAGVEGLFVRRRDSLRIVLSISLIQRSVSVEVDEADADPIS